MIYFFISLVFTNLFLYSNNYLYLVLSFITLLIFASKNNLKLVIFFCLSLTIFSTIYINKYNYSIYDLNVSKVYEVIEVKENYCLVKDDKYTYLIYLDNVNEGNKVYIKGTLNKLEKGYNSFYNYLSKKGINYEIKNYEYAIEDTSIYYNKYLINKLLSNKNEENKGYLKLILFNEKSDDNLTLYSEFSLLSLTYLIAVSGFHINTLKKFFKKIFKKEIICYAFLSFYLYLLDFSVSSYRSFLIDILKKANNKLDLSLSKIDLLSLIGITFIFKDPSIMFSYSFIFSFLSSFVLEIFSLYKSKKIFINLYIYLINLPINLLTKYKINLSTFILSSFMSYPISFLYVFSFLYLFLDKFYLLYMLFVRYLIYALKVVNEYSKTLIFGKPSLVFIVIYYAFLLFYFLMKEQKSKKRLIWLLSVFMLISYQYYKPVINNNEQVYFVNVGQGDCIAFIIPNSKSVVLIDTGGNIYKDIATKEVIPFLESKGINKIEMVITTHDDYDHNGALTSLQNNFVVEKVIDNSLFSSINIGKENFINLNVSESRDNDGSVVLYGEYAGYKLLLMGDAGTDIEEKIVDSIDEVDILKVGHHGSRTSSNEEFLDKINGKIAIVSVGKNNKYGHPHKEVISNLEKYGYYILRTDENNDIGFGKDIFGIDFTDYFKE